MYCEKATYKDGNPKKYIMCRDSGMICAHSYFCDVVRRYRQLESAQRCPGRDKK